jgi:hypothetical protein
MSRIETDAKVHTFCGLLYVSFVYEKRSEHRKRHQRMWVSMIDCLNTLWLLRAVGDWCRLIQVAVSCDKLILKVQGGAVVERLTRPPIMVHVSVNQSRTAVSRARPVCNTQRTSLEEQEDPMWDSHRTLLREMSTLTYVLEPRSLYITVQIGPIEHLVSGRTCEDRHER